MRLSNYQLHSALYIDNFFSPCANRLHNFVVILHRQLKERSKIMYYEDYEDEYAGTYAHDVAGFSDEDIDTIFDGEPEAYWNID